MCKLNLQSAIWPSIKFLFEATIQATVSIIPFVRYLCVSVDSLRRAYEGFNRSGQGGSVHKLQVVADTVPDFRTAYVYCTSGVTDRPIIGYDNYNTATQDAGGRKRGAGGRDNNSRGPMWQVESTLCDGRGQRGRFAPAKIGEVRNETRRDVNWVEFGRGRRVR